MTNKHPKAPLQRVMGIIAIAAAFALTCQSALAGPLNLVVRGTGGVAAAASGANGAAGPEIPAQPGFDNPVAALTLGPAILAPQGVAPGVASGILPGQGLNHHDERTADNGNQFSVEPPDQGMCVGNGYVLEAVNLAVRVRSAKTNLPITGATSLNRFFGLPSAIDRAASPVVRGPFTSDPKCIYDPDTRRFFLTILSLALDPATGAVQNNSEVLIAVSQSADPTGPFTVFGIDTTNNASSGPFAHAGCPCFGDQPLIGADRNGLYVSTNEFGITLPTFNGTQLYAVSKQLLARAAVGGPVPTGAYINVGALPTPDAGALWYTLQPAQFTPNDDDPGYLADSRKLHGVEYLLSALEFFGVGDTRIALWAVTNTNSLQTPNPSLGIQNVVLNGHTFYIGPPSMSQKGSAGLVQSNDDRMNQVMKFGNTLYGGVNTAITDPSGQTAGIAYWGVKPAWSNAGTLDGGIVLEGYVSVPGNNVAYPSIAVNKNGKGMMAFSLMGPDYYPSAAFVRFDAEEGAGRTVQVAGAGVAPYASFGVVPGTSAGRWGDYSAVADDQGNVWGAAEYIPVTSFGAASNGGLANWGTFIWKLNP